MKASAKQSNGVNIWFPQQPSRAHWAFACCATHRPRASLARKKLSLSLWGFSVQRAENYGALPVVTMFFFGTSCARERAAGWEEDYNVSVCKCCLWTNNLELLNLSRLSSNRCHLRFVVPGRIYRSLLSPRSMNESLLLFHRLCYLRYH